MLVVEEAERAWVSEGRYVLEDRDGREEEKRALGWSFERQVRDLERGRGRNDGFVAGGLDGSS